MIGKNQLITDLNQIRKKSPLVHNITNYVVMNNTANALLAIGASPVMAHSVDEVEEMVAIASSLVINIGTLSKEWIEAMLLAGKTANKKGIPVIFDPVGAGATTYRTKTCLLIIEECKPSVIRGNASEIMALVNSHSKTKGVDSTASADSAIDSAKILAKNTGAVVVISGPTDYITDGEKVAEVRNGSEMMTKVTGLGCTASAITGAFASVNKNYFEAATHAMAIMGIAGELAAARSEGTGTMQLNFLDELYKISDKEILENLKA
jgi:hydroxyethylthiazole kinase